MEDVINNGMGYRVPKTDSVKGEAPDIGSSAPNADVTVGSEPTLPSVPPKIDETVKDKTDKPEEKPEVLEPTEPEVPVLPVGPQTAKPATAKVIINGIEVEFTAYNINDNNYFKLPRLSRSDAQAYQRRSPRKGRWLGRCELVKQK